MKEQGKKIARGQMVYAPISSGQNKTRSPFSQMKKGLVNPVSQSEQIKQQQTQRNQSKSKAQQFPDSPYRAYEPSIKMAQSASPFHEYHQQLQILFKQNSELKAREQIYVSKMLKLQEGLQKQHEQFMKLQELYNDLFNIYKQKQEEISQLQLKYKETQKSRLDFSSNSKKDQNISLISIDKMNSVRQSLLEDNFRHELAQLIFQNKRLNETNQKLISELNYLKSKQKLNDSGQTLSRKVIQQLSGWQKQADWEKQQKIKLDYENRFLKMRNEDLEKTISELEKVISVKQSEIIKMREDKFATRRQSSQKVLNKSPPKPTSDSARSKGSNHENKKFIKLIENLQKQNHRLREENFVIKQKLKGNIFLKDANKLHDSYYSNSGQIYSNLQKRLQFVDSQSKLSSNTFRNQQNQNFNSQNINQQYFSFSRQREDRNSQEELPSFPIDLQIEGIIKNHQQLNKPSHGQDENSSQIQESA